MSTPTDENAFLTELERGLLGAVETMENLPQAGANRATEEG